MKRLLLCSAAIIALGGSLAVARTIDVWGHEFEVGDAQPTMVDVGVLTDRVSKRHMNYVKLKNGHMMAVVPMEEFTALYKMSEPTEMIGGERR